jgi:hypothetical protein
MKQEVAMVSDKERATNRLLFALSQHPEGMTTQELAEIGQQGKEQVRQLLRDSGQVHESYAGPESAKKGSIPAMLWKLKKYILGSEHDEDLKARIKAGSHG